MRPTLPSPGPVLGIETSCDDTAAAVVDGEVVLSNVVYRQTEHDEFEGVVPEIASRAHVRLIGPVVQRALREAGVTWTDLRGIAATHAPGLIGSLLVGLTYAKAAASALGTPFIGVNHLEAHLVSVRLTDPGTEPPLVALLASGGHTEIVSAPGWHSPRILGSTRDDAAGEAFDKVAILLDLGYPGGPRIERRARDGNPRAVAFPRAWMGPDSLDVSFSGLKTAVRNEVLGRGGAPALSPAEVDDLAASFQEAVIEVLVTKTLRAAEREGVRTLVLAGGVAANRALRDRLDGEARARGLRLAVPDLAFCGDNGAMVALAGALRLSRGERSGWDLPAVPGLAETSFAASPGS